jgi:hypothetical protein
MWFEGTTPTMEAEVIGLEEAIMWLSEMVLGHHEGAVRGIIHIRFKNNSTGELDTILLPKTLRR